MTAPIESRRAPATAPRLRVVDRRGASVRPLREDPDLLAGVPARDQAALLESVAPLVELEPGPWPSEALQLDAAGFGLLVLDGFVSIRTTIGRPTHAELTGPGDVIRPWQGYPDDDHLGRTIECQILTPVRCAVLDDRFIRDVAAWPRVIAELAGRIMQRGRALSHLTAAISLPRIDDRIVQAVSYFAERWGRMTPEGSVVELPLTHRLLAEIVASRRPSVTTALGRLERERRLLRAGNRWILPRREH